MNTAQIYDIVNSVTSQALGRDDLEAVDTASFIAMGDAILSSNTNTEPFINTLVQRIARTVVSFRAYDSKWKELAITDVDFGRIMQKVKVAMPEFVSDVSVELEDGETVDPYIISKPVAHQKLFVVRSPYTCFVTIQRHWLKEAFTSEDAMESFISAIFGEMQNAQAVALENLGRACVSNFIANMGDSQKVHLLTGYLADVPGATAGLTAQQAMYDAGFLRYAMGQMKYYSDRMTEMSVLYNKEGETRHTPITDQRFLIRSDYLNHMETQVDYAAFNDRYLKKAADLTVNFWQGAEEPGTIIVKGGEGEEDIEIENILGFIHDRDALGLFRKDVETLTTPVNARGRYYNVFQHVDDMRFNDLSENGILFLVD